MKYYPTINNKITLSGKLGELEIAMLSKQHEPDSEIQVYIFQLYGIYKKRGRMKVEVYLGRERCGREGEKE